MKTTKLKLNKILGEEIDKFLSELIDPNFGGMYQPQGLDPSVVKLYEDDLDESYQSVQEIKDLAYDIIKYTVNQNYKRFNNIKKIDYIYGIHLSNINHSKYKEVADFIENSNIYISFPPKGDNGIRGTYQTIITKNGDFNPKEERNIEVFLDYEDIRDSYERKIEEYGEVSERDLLHLLYYKMFSALVHELQHAFDDYRSKNKIYQTKEYKQYLEKYINDKVRDDQFDDLKKVEDYLNLPHEIWARFSQAVQRISFYTFDFIDDINYIQKMHPIRDVVRSFLREFSGYGVLSDEMKKRLVKKIVQFWHYEKEKIDQENKELISQSQS